MIAGLIGIALSALFVLAAIGALAVLVDSVVRGIEAARRLRREVEEAREQVPG